MLRLSALASVTAITGLFAFAEPGPVSAEERTCRGRIGAITLDNIRVPPGATCRLVGTKAKGTVKIENNAKLIAKDVVVIGNVQAENAKNVKVLQDSRVGGSVQVKQGDKAKVANSKVNGDIQYDDNDEKVVARKNKVGGNIQVFQNTGGVVIFGNVVDGNLQCKENKPRPTGGKNKVDGNREDQCKRL